VDLTARRFLNLIHHWRVATLPADTEPDAIERLNQLLTGPRTDQTDRTVDAESGLVPPPWWDGDEEASRSAMAAHAAR
jgi:hypothetical protein